MPHLTQQQLEQDWATNPRWKGIKRTYSAADVVRLRGTMPVEHTLAKRGAEKTRAAIKGEGGDKAVDKAADKP